MPIHLELQRNGRVLVANYSHPVTSQDLDYAFNYYREVCDADSLPVHNITNVLGITELPTNVMALARKYYSNTLRHRNAGTFVVISNNSFFVSFSRIATQLMPGLRVQFVSTPEQAWRQIDRLLDESPTSAV